MYLHDVCITIGVDWYMNHLNDDAINIVNFKVWNVAK